MIITRAYHPKLWWMAMVGHIIYCGAMVASSWEAWSGSTLLGEYALVALVGLGMLKGTNRAGIAKAALPHKEMWFKRHGWVLTWFVPLGTWAWLIGLLLSATTRTVWWRGSRYDL